MTFNPINSAPVTKTGGAGQSLEFDWDGTKLGVRVEGDDEYEYVDLRGPAGPAGQDGADGSPGADGSDGEPGPAGKDGTDGKDGAKGDPFTYEDFTEEQLEALRGPKGEPGEDGADGFPSEEQWNALEERVRELEGSSGDTE